MYTKDENSSGYKSLRVDEESYNRIDFLSKKESVSKLSCVSYMTRFFVESGISFKSGKQSADDAKNGNVSEDIAVGTERVIKLIKWMEKEYFKPFSRRMTLLETDTVEATSLLREIAVLRSDAMEPDHDNKSKLTNNDVASEISRQSQRAVIAENQEELKDMRIKKERAELRLKGALELLERSISPSFCTLIEDGEFGARNHKYTRADVEEIKSYIRQCTSI